MGAGSESEPRQGNLELGLNEAVARPRVDGIIAEHLEAEGAVVLCAGAGMGKTMAAEERVRAVREAGGSAIHLRLSGRAPSSACRSIREAARAVLAGKRHARLVVLDDVPALDEDEVASVATSVARLLEDGRQVLVCLRPDALPLALALGAPIVHAGTLLVREEELIRWNVALADNPRIAIEATAGIPALVAALCGEPAVLAPGAAGPTAFSEALQRMVGCALEGCLMDEERRLRCAMLLMGAGYISEAQGVAGRSDASVLAQMQRDEPLFGLDLSKGEFQIVGSQGPAGADALAAAVQAAKAFPDLASRVVEVLAWRGDFRRCGDVARRCLAPDELRRLVGAWPVEFLNAGRIELVSEALNAQGRARVRGLNAARVAHAALVGSREDLDRALPLVAGAQTRREQTVHRQVELLLRARNLDSRVPVVALSEAGDVSDPVVRLLSTHVVARSMIWRGEFTRAFRYLLVGGELLAGNTVASALLQGDFDLARCLAGDMPSRTEDERSVRAATMLAAYGMDDLVVYQQGIRPLLAALAGHACPEVQLESCLSRSVRRGDVLVQGLALLALACSDLRKDALARAHVRASRALEVARRANCAWMALGAMLADGISLARLGDTGALESIAVSGGREGVFARLALHALGSNGGAPGKLRAELGQHLAREEDLMPLVNLLAWACNRELVHEALSGQWSSRLAQFERAMEAWFPPATEPAMDAVGTSSSPAPDEVVQVRMLGKFEVVVRGKHVSESAWGRRSAQQLLMLLVAAQGHTLSRSEAMEAIWPESDYVAGRGNLYTALSALRKVLGEAQDGTPCVLGMTGYLSLNTDYVHSDVDEFEALAQKLLSGHGGDDWTVETCERLSALYGGELFIPTLGSPSIFLRRRNGLRRLFVDAMVMGSEAALRQGDAREAIQLARDAYRAAPLREDAVAALVQALFASGRAVEAKEAYDAFSASTIRASGMPPSARLRALYGSMAGAEQRRPSAQEPQLFHEEEPAQVRRTPKRARRRKAAPEAQEQGALVLEELA